VKESDVVDILMPYAESTSVGGWTEAARIGSLRGTTVGIVNNSWRCMHVIATELHTLLGEHGVTEVDERQISAAQTLPDDQLAELADRCAAVVVGIGN
jgi:hypothetical protein